jgi:hypothetical protein
MSPSSRCSLSPRPARGGGRRPEFAGCGGDLRLRGAEVRHPLGHASLEGLSAVSGSHLLDKAAPMRPAASARSGGRGWVRSSRGSADRCRKNTAGRTGCWPRPIGPLPARSNPTRESAGDFQGSPTNSRRPRPWGGSRAPAQYSARRGSGRFGSTDRKRLAIPPFNAGLPRVVESGDHSFKTPAALGRSQQDAWHEVDAAVAEWMARVSRESG